MALEAVQAQAGHASIESTRIYLHLADDWLAAQLPAAVLADLLGLHQTTAAKWMHQAGGDWSRYAAELARRPHQT